MVIRANQRNYTTDAIKKFYLREKNTRLKIRPLGIKLSNEGKSTQNISDILIMSRQTIANWILNFYDYAIDGLQNNDTLVRPKLIA